MEKNEGWCLPRLLFPSLNKTKQKKVIVFPSFLLLHPSLKIKIKKWRNQALDDLQAAFSPTKHQDYEITTSSAKS